MRSDLPTPLLGAIHFRRVATVLLALSVALLCGVTYAHAATYTWSPGTDNYEDWEDTNRWEEGVAPLTGNTNDVLFMITNDSTRVRTYLGKDVQVRSMTFSNVVDGASRIVLDTKSGGTGASRQLRFESSTGQATLTVQSGMTANIDIGLAGDASSKSVGSVYLEDNLLIDHNGTGVLDIDTTVLSTGSLTKTGTGVFSLTPNNSNSIDAYTNTYSGDTIVSEGTFMLGSVGALSSNTTVRIASPGKISLTATNTVAALYLDGTQTRAGTWGSSSSSAEFKNNTYFESSASGILKVISGGRLSGMVMSVR